MNEASVLSRTSVQDKRIARMNRVDEFDPVTRSLIHEYGLNTITQFVNAGVTKPNVIRHLVETVLDEFSPTRGSYSAQGIRSAIFDNHQPKGK